MGCLRVANRGNISQKEVIDMAKKVIGQYKCGCSYGPIEKAKRLTYCGVHGNDIQDEYVVPKNPKLRRNTNE